MSGGGGVRLSRGARVGGMKSRGIRGVVSWCPLRSGECRATANRVEQQLASRYRVDVRSSTTRVSSYVMTLQTLQKFELSRQASKAGPCATEMAV